MADFSQDAQVRKKHCIWSKHHIWHFKINWTLRLFDFQQTIFYDLFFALLIIHSIFSLPGFSYSFKNYYASKVHAHYLSPSFIDWTSNLLIDSSCPNYFRLLQVCKLFIILRGIYLVRDVDFKYSKRYIKKESPYKLCHEFHIQARVYWLIPVFLMKDYVFRDLTGSAWRQHEHARQEHNGQCRDGLRKTGTFCLFPKYRNQYAGENTIISCTTVSYIVAKLLSLQCST